jgi:uncharacterized protein (TIGR02246 family)
MPGGGGEAKTLLCKDCFPEDTMRKAILVIVSCVGFAFAGSESGTAQEGTASADRVRDEIIALERGALDRWIKLDPQGYLDLFVPDVTYFDPTTDRRIEGREAMEARLAPMRSAKVPFKAWRYDMIEPRVQRHGDVAVLTFNLVNYGTMPDQPERVIARWNSTEVYRRVDGAWKIVHSHWSFTKPEVKQPVL